MFPVLFAFRTSHLHHDDDEDNPDFKDGHGDDDDEENPDCGNDDVDDDANPDNDDGDEDEFCWCRKACEN